MKKLTITIGIIAALMTSSCYLIEDAEPCTCDKITYRLKFHSNNGTIGMHYEEYNREEVPCQDEKKWGKGEYTYEIECK